MSDQVAAHEHVCHACGEWAEWWHDGEYWCRACCRGRIENFCDCRTCFAWFGKQNWTVVATGRVVQTRQLVDLARRRDNERVLREKFPPTERQLQELAQLGTDSAVPGLTVKVVSPPIGEQLEDNK